MKANFHDNVSREADVKANFHDNVSREADVKANFHDNVSREADVKADFDDNVSREADSSGLEYEPENVLSFAKWVCSLIKGGNLGNLLFFVLNLF